MASKSKTVKQISAEVSGLLALKKNPKFRRFSAFGDDHFRSIDIQVAVLESDWDTDDINERYSDSDANSTAYDTLRWKNGEEEDEAPMEGWASLVRP